MDRTLPEMLAVTQVVIQSAAAAVYRDSRRQNGAAALLVSVTGGRTALLSRSAV